MTHEGSDDARAPEKPSDEFPGDRPGDDWSPGDRARMDDLAHAEGPDPSFDAPAAGARAPARSFAGAARAGQARGLDEVKALLGAALRAPDLLAPPEGAPTGVDGFDRRLLWGGFPKGEMTLLWGELGTGATSLWIEAAGAALKAHKWAAWIDGETPLCPISFRQKGADLSRLLVVQAAPAGPSDDPTGDAKSWLGVTRELLASALFEVIGSGAPVALRLRESQARKLLASCRAAKAALVLVARGPPPPYADLFALIARFEEKRILVERALHRPPFELPRRLSYATFSQHLRAGDDPDPGARPLPAPQAGF